MDQSSMTVLCLTHENRDFCENRAHADTGKQGGQNIKISTIPYLFSYFWPTHENLDFHENLCACGCGGAGGPKI
jgi:hypothetical protein